MRRGRFSCPDASYFATICTANQLKGLANPQVDERLKAIIHQMGKEGVCQVRCWTLMPDHLHAVLRLGTTRSLPEAMRLLKGRITTELRRLGLRWERGYYDHRIRTEEKLLPIFLYIFLNPFRRHLLSENEIWPYFHCATEDWKWFQPLTNESTPFPEWLR